MRATGAPYAGAMQAETSRTHQIRACMAHIRHPPAGDPVYGGKPRLLPPVLQDALWLFDRQALHAQPGWRWFTPATRPSVASAVAGRFPAVAG